MIQKTLKDNDLSKLISEWKKNADFKNILIEELEDNKEYLVSLKIDGEATAFAYKDGKVIFSSRNGKVRTDFPAAYELADKLKGHKFVVGFGELYAKDKDGNILPYPEAMSIIRKPEGRESQIHFAIYDIYLVDGERIEGPYEKRLEKIKAILGE